MAYRLFDTKPSYKPKLNYCLLGWTLWNKLQWNPNQIVQVVSQENSLENVVCKTPVFCLGPNLSTWVHVNNQHQRLVFTIIDILIPGDAYESRKIMVHVMAWWRHQMKTFSALLALCAGNSQVPGEFPAQRPVTRSCDVFFDLRPNKRLSKQSWGWWLETLLCSLWRHCNGFGAKPLSEPKLAYWWFGSWEQISFELWKWIWKKSSA